MPTKVRQCCLFVCLFLAALLTVFYIRRYIYLFHTGQLFCIFFRSQKAVPKTEISLPSFVSLCVYFLLSPPPPLPPPPPLSFPRPHSWIMHNSSPRIKTRKVSISKAETTEKKEKYVCVAMAISAHSELINFKT